MTRIKFVNDNLSHGKLIDSEMAFQFLDFTVRDRSPRSCDARIDGQGSN